MKATKGRKTNSRRGKKSLPPANTTSKYIRRMNRMICTVVLILVTALHAQIHQQQKTKLDLQKIADEIQGSDPFKHDSQQDELEDQSEDVNQPIIQAAAALPQSSANRTGSASVNVPSLSSTSSSWKYKSNRPTTFAATPRPSQFMPKQKVRSPLCTLSSFSL